jgi:two-component system NtrC family sensor kinase
LQCSLEDQRFVLPFELFDRYQQPGPTWDILPWRESEDLPRIGDRREPPEAGDMQRRGGSGQPAKGQRQGAQPKARKTPTGPASTDHSAEQFDRLLRERDEALEQLAATSEVLHIIGSSSGELKPAFQTMLEKATTLCGATFGNMYLRKGDAFKLAATYNSPPALIEERARAPYILGAGSPPDRMVKTKSAVHIVDLASSEFYLSGDPRAVAGVELGGVRTVLLVPMLKDAEVVGHFAIFRQEVRPFTERQIELVKSFAAQAVIAIENTRLLNELRQRTDDLSESLEQQTATSEVLKVISSSPGDLQPVFDTILANATELCGARFASLRLCEGDLFRTVSLYNAPAALVEHWRGTPLIRPHPESALGRTALTKQVVQIDDVRKGPAYRKGDPLSVAGVDLGGYLTVLSAPMLKEEVLIGAIAIYRQEVRPFTDKQIELVTNFAAQAVIAIENARLLSELRESLQQQTATADVLKVISSSPGELEPVFNAMLENATHICAAEFGTLYLRETDSFRAVAIHNAPEEYVRARKGQQVRPPADSALGQVAATHEVAQIDDITKIKSYVEGNSYAVSAHKLGGYRTIAAVPMLKDDELVGAILVYRQEVRLFSEKQIELVKNFAAQAVIAIENSRLLNELRESLQQQTATAEVLKVISRSTFDLPSVLQTLVESAARLCDADKAIITREKNGVFYRAEAYGFSREFMDQVRDTPVKAERGSGIGRALLESRVIHILDVKADPDYTFIEHQKLGDFRTLLAVPMLREGVPKGMVSLTRSEMRPFTGKQIELATTFADQAAIAIENARLLRELHERTHELEAQSQEVAKLNQQLEQRVADQVSEIERMGRLRRFLPPQVADLIVASGAEKQLESHRREITALFCDLRGFTGFSESSDPEDVIALLREYHAAIGGIINRYGGTLERYAGDGVMVVFNDPIPVDNPALQAVRMAIDMRAAIGGLIEKWRKLGHDIGFGIGIAHGFATLGTIGFEGRFDYAAIGTVSNVASRLCDEAKPGQILISPRVLMAAEKDIAVEPVGDFALKGIRRPLTAYNVLATKAAD